MHINRSKAKSSNFGPLISKNVASFRQPQHPSAASSSAWSDAAPQPPSVEGAAHGESFGELETRLPVPDPGRNTRGVSSGDSVGARKAHFDIGEEIERALDDLRYAEGLMAYLGVARLRTPGICRRLLDEALLAYEQSLSRQKDQSFEEARRLAVASRSISHAAKILLFRVVPLDETLMPFASPWPDHVAVGSALSHTQTRLQGIETQLSGIQSCALTSEAWSRVRKLELWSEALCGQARSFCQNDAIQDAVELTQAAEAIARSAECLCGIDHPNVYGE